MFGLVRIMFLLSGKSKQNTISGVSQYKTRLGYLLDPNQSDILILGQF